MLRVDGARGDGWWARRRYLRLSVVRGQKDRSLKSVQDSQRLLRRSVFGLNVRAKDRWKS